jgi:mRNA interferase MazF
VSTLRAGLIVLVDWRDALPKEPNKLRPAVVVEDDEGFDESYPNVILVPLSGDVFAVPREFTLAIDPTPENGCAARCYALSCSVTTASIRRVRPTDSRVLPDQLSVIRHQIAMAIGLE